eukprot:TRINITY_DN39953_c0_g1_i2.p2 TRINITY_DN39953_c0_g1~~TRINITY_DN39953_c0_g1_i2.p2  ORF type:complete len:413 (+),score=57.01 TRINITY_DN39953_c0_g1_i2:43-1281(+)
MDFFQTRKQVNRSKLLFVLCMGCLVGLFLGYIFMGTMHAILEIGVETHYSDQSASLGRKVDVGTSEQTSKQNVDRSSEWPKSGNTVHTLVTSNGSPYQNIQCRLMYGSYKLVQKMEGGERLVAFTRILHRTQDDVAVDEIPSWRADPLTPKCDHWCEFPVSDRPNAVVQFIQAAKKDPSLIKAPWLLLIETDYVWIKPLESPGEASDPSVQPQSFLFGYINPTYPSLKQQIRKLYPESEGGLEKVPRTGPAPVLLRVRELEKVAPEWERLTAQIEADKELKDALGWVREMYAFSCAAALTGINLKTAEVPETILIAQPPADVRSGRASLLHYTWGSIYKTSEGGTVWKFDKRDWTDAKYALKLPKFDEPPENIDGLKLQDGKKVTKEMNDLLRVMIQQFNIVSKDLPTLKEQ